MIIGVPVEGFSRFPRQLGGGWGWFCRTKKHHWLYECLNQCNKSSAYEGQGSLVHIVPNCWWVQLWEEIASAKSSNKSVRLQILKGELESIKMKETKGAFEYITRIETMVNQLNKNGEMLLASRLVEKMVRSLTVENLIFSSEAHKKKKKKKKKKNVESID